MMTIKELKIETHGLVLDGQQLQAILGGTGEFPDPPPPEAP